MVGRAGVEFGNQCAAYRECGADEEDCKSDGLLVQRESSGDPCAELNCE